MRTLRKHAILAISALLFACDQDPTGPVGKAPTETQPELAVGPPGSWAIKASMRKPRTHLKAATVHGVIYAIGGFGGPARVEAYDVASNTWTVKQRLPEGLIPNGATSIRGKIYVAGGWKTRNGTIRYSRALYVYDPATDTWTRKASLPFRVGRFAGHQDAIDGKLYLYAGVTVNADGSEGPHRFLRYDPATDNWTNLHRPSYARRGGAAGAIDGKFYLVGGSLPESRNGMGRAWDVHVYDPAAGWSKRPLGHFGLHTSELAYAPLGGKLYIVGLDDREDNCLVDASAVYDPVTNSLSPFATPAPLRQRAAGVAARRQFFVLGGFDREPRDFECAGGIGTPTAEVRVYSP